MGVHLRSTVRAANGSSARRLPAPAGLVASSCLLFTALTACSSSNAPTSKAGLLVSGTLQTVGGPPPGQSHYVPGTVVFHGRQAAPITAPVDRNGRFTITVTAGTYTVVGFSPRYYNGPCDGVRVTIPSVAPTPRVHVYCQEA